MTFATTTSRGALGVLRSLLAGIGGYFVIVLGQVLFLELLLGGITIDSPWTDLAIATLGTLFSGLVGGFVAARLGASRWIAPLVLLALLAFDTAYVLTTGLGGQPFWFDLGGATTLFGATAAGAWVGEAKRPG